MELTQHIKILLSVNLFHPANKPNNVCCLRQLILLSANQFLSKYFWLAALQDMHASAACKQTRHESLKALGTTGEMLIV